MKKATRNRLSTWLCFFLTLLLILPTAGFAEGEGSDVPEETEEAAEVSTGNEIPDDFVPPFGGDVEDYAASGGEGGDMDGMMESTGFGMSGLPGQLGEEFDADDIPDGYLKKCKEQQGYVEKLRYTSTEGQEKKICTVYIPYGYDACDTKYNVLYVIHASSGDPENYLSPTKETNFKNLLDNMIADEVIAPLIVVCPTYYATDDTDSDKSAALEAQVRESMSFPQEIVGDVIPLVELKYRTWLEAGDEEDPTEAIVASRDHRGIAGFSLGGVATWNAFRTEMKAFRWFLPMSEASWTDDEGGTTGIWDSDVSAKVLADAVVSQGYAKDDFRLFMATGSDDEAFDISTSQMASLLDEYPELFNTGENTSCCMMSNGEHKLSAVYTYMYHILPALFYVEPETEAETAAE